MRLLDLTMTGKTDPDHPLHCTKVVCKPIAGRPFDRVYAMTLVQTVGLHDQPGADGVSVEYTAGTFPKLPNIWHPIRPLLLSARAGRYVMKRFPLSFDMDIRLSLKTRHASGLIDELCHDHSAQLVGASVESDASATRFEWKLLVIGSVENATEFVKVQLCDVFLDVAVGEAGMGQVTMDDALKDDDQVQIPGMPAQLPPEPGAGPQPSQSVS